MRTRVKICGITREADARLAVELGADALGFVFWSRSPRAVAPDVARAIAGSLPAMVVRVGVFVDATPEEVARTVRHVGLDAAQLHGDEVVEAYSAVGVRLIKAVTADDEAGVERARACPPSVTVLIDASDRERRGGTGRVTNWARAARVAAARPVILAGGLHAGNVRAAMTEVRPWGLDVSSGVEEAPGIKDATRLGRFFEQVRREAEGR